MTSLDDLVNMSTTELRVLRDTYVKIIHIIEDELLNRSVRNEREKETRL
jgi:hypothetical protein